VFLLLISAVLYFGVNIGEVYYRYFQYKELMAQEIRFRSDLADATIKRNLQAIADSLGLPEDAGAVVITRDRGRIEIESHYEETVDLPGFKRDIHFEPKASGTY
jgi:hypothetical protein